MPSKSARAAQAKHLRIVASDDERRWQEQIILANRIAALGGRSVLEAMRAVRRGESIQCVLEEFQILVEAA
jgi:hypothetical protein